MDGEEYQELCKRTDRAEVQNVPKRLLHGAIGCGTEAGELLDIVKRALFYGTEIDRTHILEELGDLSWYISQILNEVGASWSDIWEMNIEKLRVQYPEQFFTEERALNRDLDAERKALKNSPVKWSIRPSLDSIKILAHDLHGNTEEITDLYWFEENGVHDFNGQGSHQRFIIQLFIDDIQII